MWVQKAIDVDGDGIPDEWEAIPFPEENALLSDISERQRLFHLAADKCASPTDHHRMTARRATISTIRHVTC